MLFFGVPEQVDVVCGCRVPNRATIGPASTSAAIMFGFKFADDCLARRGGGVGALFTGLGLGHALAFGSLLQLSFQQGVHAHGNCHDALRL